MRNIHRLVPLLAALLDACSRDPSRCPSPDRDLSFAGRCYGQGELLGNALAWGIGLAFAIWWIATIAGLRRDVRRIAESLDRKRDE